MAALCRIGTYPSGGMAVTVIRRQRKEDGGSAVAALGSVFLSHSSHDREWTRKLAGDLEQAGSAFSSMSGTSVTATCSSPGSITGCGQLRTG